MPLDTFYSSKQILNWRRDQLLKGGRAVDLDWLLDIGGGLGWSTVQKIKIFQNTSHKLDFSLDELALLWTKHLNDHTPLQYLLGRCPWRDFELEVNSSALIPRQETELLVDIALNKALSLGNNFSRWADLGTGSGALAVALGRSLPDSYGHAVDCSKDALELAKKNIKGLVMNAEILLHLGYWWEPLRSWWGEFDLVVANPPYISNAKLQDLDLVVRDHEPHLALSGGKDGMNSLREIVQGAMKGLRKGGWLLLEHDFDQSDSILELLRNEGLDKVNFENDLEGVRRFALARHP
ncbi:peptide chain release factor N(5)-glutamine methyltransferase [Prochlorococcus marinus]|uniref:peptide chain release factor N(5)-glutamine methyltransferase n=1 Tax=Prochlorococcus marinus TaxID=1219 RepID=UPI0022B35B03|nr:peptide chain release factor N(5)-glutamine methyltransferase [Prochlorococcus marinus]